MKTNLLLSLFAAAALSTAAYAQPQAPNLLYDKEHNFGVMMHTKGFGGVLQFSRHTKEDNYRLLDFGIYSLRHPKEVKLPNELLGESRPYVFGKQYAPVILQAGIGRRRIMADKLTMQSVRVNLNYSLGPALAVLKPVYYEVKIPNPEPGQDRKKYQRFNADDIQMQDNTIGAAPFMKGIGESGFVPGGFGKASISFEWGGFDYKFYSLEAGVLVNAFPINLPIFAYPVNDRVFVNLFLALSYGARK